MKVMVLGDGGVGKTSIIRRILGEEFELKVPMDYGEARLHFEPRHIPTMKMQIHAYKEYEFYDYSQDNYITYSKCSCFCCYSIVTRPSPIFKYMDKALIITDNKHTDVSKWYQYVPNKPFLIVVNKYDKEEEFPQLRYHPEAVRVSCKYNTGFDKIIEFLQE